MLFFNRLWGWAFDKRMITPPQSPGLEFGGGHGLDDFGSHWYRMGRYNLFWACYINSAYDDCHSWSQRYKGDYGLYQYTRGAYNPLFRLGEFWGNHTWGGRLKAELVNGRVTDSAIPILTQDEDIRGAIARVWRDSNWQTNKDLSARVGAIKGDIAFKVEDDREAGKVRICPVDPSTITWVNLDRQGNCDGYMLEERRLDPRDVNERLREMAPGTVVPLEQTVRYTEKVWREGGTIRFETYLGDSLYPWNGETATWEVDYGFVPFVLNPHFKVYPDYPWGFSEYQCGLAKARECDDIGSKLHDQIRKAADPKWFIAGATVPSTRGLKVSGAVASGNNTEPGRQELPFIYGGVGATAMPMVFSLDIQFTSMEIQNQIAALEKDYPELRYDSARVSGDASAKALREARKTAEAKVHIRRAGYDNAHKRSLQMAVAIGGFRGYDGYDSYGLESYEGGDLEFEIGDRSVFLLDPLDRLEEETAFVNAMEIAKRGGMPAVTFLRRMDWSESQIAEFLRDQAAEDKRIVNQTRAIEEAKAAAQPQPQPFAGVGG